MKKIFILIIVFVALLPRRTQALTPTDPHLTQWSYADTKVFEAWDRATGSRDVVVAVIDNGFDTFHPDLYGNTWKNEKEIADNDIDDDHNGYIDDVWGWDFSPNDEDGDGLIDEEEKARGDNEPRPRVDGVRHISQTIHHGTVVAGIIGAIGNNGEDGAGINWQVRLMNLKVINNDTINEQEPLIKAIRYAVDNGADIINASLVGDMDQDIRAAVKYAYDHGVAVIAASGNTRVALNLSPLDPVCADNDQKEEWVLGVSAVGPDRFLAPFSNTGSNCVDITAPGEDIRGTLRYAPRYGLTERYGGSWQGTSFAAPFVSGAAALIKAIQPAWGPKQIYQAILATVHRTPPTDVAAYEDLYGAGLLQIDKAVEYALAQLTSARRLKNVWSVDLASGSLTDKAAGAGAEKTRLEVALKQVDNVAVYRDGYATYRQARKGLGEVVMYDREWRLQTHWAVPARLVQDIVVGDVLGEGEVEIILAPAASDKQVLRVFNLAGKQLKQLSISGAHAGVSLGLIDSANDKQEILAVYRDNGVTMLRHFDAELGVVRGIPLPFVRSTGPVAAGDIDGDGVEEYIVGSGALDAPVIAFFEPTRQLLRQFSVYDGSYTGGLSLAVGDYDGDNQDDVVVAPRLGRGLPVRVWSRRSKKLAEWPMAGSEIRVLPVYK